ncbi:MAG: S-methyl-5-thioribose-1-phosphate isomerase [Planctomycetes bacterium]|nr:S-methyl-5-thioribose-1-phosphate isomerase [Planctomycetota bacterium]
MDKPGISMIETISWQGGIDGEARIIDQTLLPDEFVIKSIRTKEDMWEAIKVLRVRGAPLIGCSAAYGVVLGMKGARGDLKALSKTAHEVCDYLATSRPTAVNLFWALGEMRKVADGFEGEGESAFKEALLSRAHEILEQDREMGRAIGRFGADLIPNGAACITHCNAGALATGGTGTALSLFYAAKEQGKTIRVFSDETRPLLQGSRLTAFELMRSGIDTTVIVDSAAAHAMRTQGISVAVVGADRIAANGDTANKIGTYQLAISAKRHEVQFIVAAPSSTFDLSIKSGDEIPIEERSSDEIVRGFGKLTAPADAKTFAPAFDVTPAELITAIVTEKGVISPVNEGNVRKIISHCRVPEIG